MELLFRVSKSVLREAHSPQARSHVLTRGPVDCLTRVSLLYRGSSLFLNIIARVTLPTLVTRGSPSCNMHRYPRIKSFEDSFC